MFLQPVYTNRICFYLKDRSVKFGLYNYNKGSIKKQCFFNFLLIYCVMLYVRAQDNPQKCYDYVMLISESS